MTLWQSVLLGVVEGLSEFIPVSSTAHMLLAQEMLGIPADQTVFAYLVLVQLGAIAALLVYFRREFWQLAVGLVTAPVSSASGRLAWLILLATVPALAAGALLRGVVEDLFANPLLEAAIRLLTAASVLGLAEWVGRRSRGLDSMKWNDALVVGLFQVLAVFPGASRSGAAIGGGMLRNFDRSSATRFAFFMSAPVMLAAGVYEAAGALRAGTAADLLPALPAGILAAGTTGWLSIRWLINFVSRHPLYVFAVYCAVVGAICLVLLVS